MNFIGPDKKLIFLIQYKIGKSLLYSENSKVYKLLWSFINNLILALIVSVEVLWRYYYILLIIQFFDV